MKTPFVLVGFLLLATAVAQQHDEPRPKGVIYGIAVGQDGQPAREIGLTADPLGVALGAVLPHVKTNDKGEYRFENLPWWGRYTVTGLVGLRRAVPRRVVGVAGPVHCAAVELVQNREQVRGVVVGIIGVDAVGPGELGTAAERVIAEREVVRLEIVQTAQTVERVVVVVRRTVLRVGHARPVGGGIIAVLHREGARRQEGIGGARLGQPVHVVIGEAVGAGWVLNLGQPAQRAQEMAIRIALGSQRSGMLGLVFTSAAKLAIGGCVMGLPGAAAASHLLQSFLFGVSPFDPLVMALAAVFVLILAELSQLGSPDPVKCF